MIFRQIVKALIKVHKKGIIHRDLKPENILLMLEDKICISDFGFALYMTDPELKTYNRVGTLEFYPYEMVAKDPITQGLKYD